MNALSDTLYYAMQSLETQLAMQNMCRTGWPCRQIVRTGMDIAGMMLGDDEVEEHREAYISLVCRRLCGDTRETMLTLIMMTALFNLMPTDHQARRCKSILSDQWADDIYDIYNTLCKAVDTQIDGLLEKLHAHTFSISVMKSEQPQTIINVAGNYIAQQNIDIHDNNNCNIYATAEPKQEAQPTMPDDLPSAAPSNAIAQASAVPFLVPDKLNELGTYSISELEALYHDAAKAGAPQLVKFIKHYRELEVLNTDGYNKKQTFEELKAFFGSEISFGYPNFAAYY